jgi:DNA-binding CsgD family transcriptional regulator/PAS domain-containing protein
VSDSPRDVRGSGLPGDKHDLVASDPVHDLKVKQVSTDRGIRDAFGVTELSLELIELRNFTICAVSAAALKHLGLSVHALIGRPLFEILREDEREASRIALEAMRDGIIDFYRAYRHLFSPSDSGLAFTAWARSAVFDGERFALVELVFDTATTQSPLVTLLGREPQLMALGTMDASWIVTMVSSNIVELLGLSVESVLGRQLLGAIAQGDVQMLLDADRMVAKGYSVARRIRMRDHTGNWQQLCCVVTSLAASTGRCFILLKDPDLSYFDAVDRARELEQHLLRIAAEVDASGILQRVGTLPDPSQLPEIAQLSRRQWEVLNRLMQGQRVSTIAEEMYLSQSTVRNHLSAIFMRFDVHSQSELLALLMGR